MLGMTEGELLLVSFVFALVYAAAYVPRVGSFVGKWAGKRLAGKPGRASGG